MCPTCGTEGPEYQAALRRREAAALAVKAAGNGHSHQAADDGQGNVVSDPGNSLTGLAALQLDPENQATQLVDLARKHFDLFVSDDGRAWAIEHHGPNVAIKLGRQGAFARRLGRKYIEEYRKAPGDQAIGGAVQIITAFLDDNDPQPVFLRIARHKNGLVLDLGRADGKCVIVTASGWRVEDRSPVPFRRARTKPLPIPKKGKGLAKLRKLVNADDDGFRLVVACLICYLIPDIPYPILVVRGEQGTAKSTLVKICIRCIDPGRDPGPLPRDERNFSIRMWNGHVHGFDNLASIADYQSDMLCRAATGDDYGERTLYTDDEMTSLPYRRAIILNGIDLGAVKPDLADREVPVTLMKLRRRRAERTVIGDDDGNEPGVLDEFDKANAEILGALLDILADVLKYLPKVGKVELPRMADFGKVLAALDLRHKETHGEEHSKPLLKMYRQLSRATVAESARDDIVGNAVLEFMKDHRSGWEGTTAALLDELIGTLPKPAPDKLPRGWPASSQAFGHRIPKINPALRANGWEIIRGEHARQGTPCWVQPYHFDATSSSPSSPSSHSASEQGELGDEPRDEPVTNPDFGAVSADDAEWADDWADDVRDELGDPETEFVTEFVTGVSAGEIASGDDGDDVTNLPQISGVTGSWPAAETGPCIKCNRPCHRYGDGGRALCDDCQAGHPTPKLMPTRRRNQP
jgi:hypothetical protein